MLLRDSEPNDGPEGIKLDVQLVSISGGTDIVSCFVLGNPVKAVWRGEIQGPGLGLAVDVWDDEASLCARKGARKCHVVRGLTIDG